MYDINPIILPDITNDIADFEGRYMILILKTVGRHQYWDFTRLFFNYFSLFSFVL